MWAVIGILILIGIILLVLEILVIPGAGFAGVLGFLMLVAGVWLAYAREGTFAGNLTLAITLLLNLITLIIVFRSKTWKKAQLDTAITGQVRSMEGVELHEGEQGISLTRCAPIGKARFGEYELEVDAGTAYIDPDTSIEIRKIEGNKIYIKRLTQ
jgi:membrane-bound ClpP family serine protease